MAPATAFVGAIQRRKRHDVRDICFRFRVLLARVLYGERPLGAPSKKVNAMKPRLRIVTEEDTERVFGSHRFIGLTRRPNMPGPERFVATVKGPDDVVIGAMPSARATHEPSLKSRPTVGVAIAGER
jgi:hypothetical protein